jgi:ParB family chromosome partitioning protein
MSKPVKSRLGRGLSSLIRSDIVEQVPPEVIQSPVPTANAAVAAVDPTRSNRGPGTIAEVPLEQIRTNPSQPRKSFDAERLESLAESLRQRGALQPIVVRPVQGGYELVAGERRLRASKLAGLKSIPVVVRPLADDELLEVALIENVQRENLNPVDKAKAYRQLSQKHGLSHDEIANRMGEDRTSVSNTIRILGLSDACLDLLAAGELSVGHAKALLSVATPASQIKLAERAVTEGWSVRRTEKEVATNQPATDPKGPTDKTPPARPAVREMQDRLAESLGTKVQIREGRRRHSGRIVIEYYNLEDFERILRAIGVDAAEGDI